MIKGTKIIFTINGENFNVARTHKDIDDLENYREKTDNYEAYVEVDGPRTYIRIETDEERYWEIADIAYDEINKKYGIESPTPAIINVGADYRVYRNGNHVNAGTAAHDIYTPIDRIVIDGDCRFEIKTLNYQLVHIIVDFKNSEKAAKWLKSINAELDWNASI